MDICRKLAVSRPEAFLPYLATCLNNLGARQSDLGQREAALTSAQEAVDTLWPFFIATPRAFARNMAPMLRTTLARLQALGQEPPPELLQRIQAVNDEAGA